MAILNFHPVRSSGFTRWLRNQFYQLEGKPPSAQALTDALGTIEGIGQFKGERTKTFVGVGEVYGTLCLDLCDEFWRGLNRIDALVYIHNVRSSQLLQRLGFRREGLLRDYFCLNGIFFDHYLFALLRREWEG